jgi:hypothetical protein
MLKMLLVEGHVYLFHFFIKFLVVYDGGLERNFINYVIELLKMVLCHIRWISETRGAWTWI